MRESSPRPFSFLFLLVLMMCAFAAFGDEPLNQVTTHEPYTFKGVRVRSNVAMPMPDRISGQRLGRNSRFEKATFAVRQTRKV